MGLGPILFVCVFLFSFFVLFCFLYSYNLLFKPGNATYNTRSGRSVDRGGVIGNLSEVYRKFIGSSSEVYWKFIGSLSGVYREFIGSLSGVFGPFIVRFIGGRSDFIGVDRGFIDPRF